MSVQPAISLTHCHSFNTHPSHQFLRRGQLHVLLGMMWLMTAGMLQLAAAQDSTDLPVIKPSDAAQHVDKQVIVEFEVASSSLLKDRDMCFLNSLKDHRQDDNFSVVLRKAGLKAFADKEIEDPAKHFLKKKVRVEGKVELYNKKPQLVVTKFEQLKVVGVRPEDE
jgi:hypothetical protein